MGIVGSIRQNEPKVYYTDNLILESSSYIVLDQKYYEKELSYDQKKQIVLEKYKLNNDMYQVLASIVASEAKPDSYYEAYAVANVIYNRTNSKRWVNHVNNIYGKNTGKNLYYQAIAPNQFTVYSSGSYKKYINNVPKTVNEAIIDLLYDEEPIHNYLSFRSNSYKGANAVQYESGGNKYFSEIALSDVINKTDTI